jgi:hypothetical protein
MATREDGAVTQGAGWSDVLQAAPEAWPIPREVAGVELPDSKLARDATDYVRELSAPVVFNHVLRTYVFGALLAGIGERHVAGYKAPNFCDLMNASPFAD